MDASGQKDQQVGLSVDKYQEMTLAKKDVVMQPLEANETYQRMITMILEAEDEEHEIQRFGKQLQEKLGLDEEGAKTMEWGMKWAIEARKRRRDAEQEQRRQEEQRQRRQEEQGQNTGQEQGKKGKQVRFGEEEETKETRAESTDEQKVMGRTTEVRTGRGSAGLVQGGDERCQADETRKGKGKGNGGKGEHEGKRGAGSKGRQQVENSVIDEDQGNTGAIRKEEENHSEDVRKLVEMMQKKEDAQEGQRGRVAANMGAGGSHPQAMSVPGTRETRGMRWADCEDEEGKEEEERTGERERDKARDWARGTDERETTRFRAERRRKERRERKESARGA